MKVLAEAIMTKFTSNPSGDLYVDVNGRMYFDKALQTVEFPYVIFVLVIEEPDYYFGVENLEKVTVRFNLFSDKESVIELCRTYYYLKNLYDYCTLSVSGYHHHKMELTDSVIDRMIVDGTWTYAVDYKLIEEED